MRHEVRGLKQGRESKRRMHILAESCCEERGGVGCSIGSAQEPLPCEVQTFVWEKKGEALTHRLSRSSSRTLALWGTVSPAFLSHAYVTLSGGIAGETEDKCGPGCGAVGTGLSGLRDR